MHHQVKFLEERTKYNPQDDQAYASWGSILVHLSIMSEDQAEKAQYLQQSFEKLEKAISINEDSKTHEGELAIFCLGNAFYFKFFLEKNDEIAEKFLKKARIKFELAVKKDKKNPMYAAMIEQLATAHDQRRATLEHLKRMEGKSEEEKHAELRLMQAQMLENVVDNCRAQLAQDSNNVGVRSAPPPHSVTSLSSCASPLVPHRTAPRLRRPLPDDSARRENRARRGRGLHSQRPPSPGRLRIMGVGGYHSRDGC
jgi:hypothetical protein